MAKYELSLPDVPRSLNPLMRAHWSKFHAEKKKWEDMLFIALHEAKVPKRLKKVHATASLRFTDRRGRDEGNFRATLEKALGDALQLQWIPDDTADIFTFGALTFEEKPGTKRTTIVLDVEEGTAVRRSPEPSTPRRAMPYNSDRPKSRASRKTFYG